MAAVCAVSALTMSLVIAPTAHADTTAPATTMPPALSATAQAISDARAKAKSTGQSVEVDALTTAVSETLANPNGTLTSTSHAEPVRVQEGTAWAAIDATLHSNTDGTLSPAVTPAGVTLSGGGSGPLATLATPDGKQLSVTAPFALPTPTLSGATATYAGVLTPDVDLQVTALPTGGWRDVIIVKTAAAAANPALKTLHFPISTTGLSVSADPAGNIALKDSSGAPRISAPTPFQWDSTKATSTGATNAGAPATSTADAPGDGAAVARMTAKVSATGIDLTPDPATFGKGTGPWYLDPTISATGYKNYATQVQEYNAGTQYKNMSGDLGTGYCGYLASAPPCPNGGGRERAYFQLGVPSAIYTIPNGAPYAPTIYSAHLDAQVTSLASPSTANIPLGLYFVQGDTGTGSGIGDGTSWNSQPCGTGSTMANCSEISKFNVNGTGGASWDVVSRIRDLAACHCTSFTIGMAPEDENNKYYRLHLANNPTVTINYDTAPSIWYPRTSPSSTIASQNKNYDCTTGGANPWDNPAWIGANQNIIISASSWSPTGMNLKQTFHMWDDNDPNFTFLQDTGWGGSYNANLSIPVGSLSDGHQYGWTASSTDGDLRSPDSAWCYFRVDRTPPNAAISSTDFPPSGTPNPSPTKYSSDSGTFTLTGTDPAPGNGLQASGLACFRVSTDSTPVTGWHCGDPGIVTADATGKATFQHVPGTWGTNFLYTQAQDNAGNYSQPAVYSYYAPWKPGTAPVFGDVDGDQQPDILLPDIAGNLRIIGASADPTRALSATAASAPGNDATHHFTWNDYQITHRGTVSGSMPVDQLIAHNVTDTNPDPKNNTKQYLFLVYNDGHGNFSQQTATHLTRPTHCVLTLGGPTGPCPASFGLDWTNVTQVTAIGTPEGENTATVGGVTKPITNTSLLAVENGQLWLFTKSGTTLNDLSDTAQLIPAADGTNWNNYDLIAPGPANGTTTDSTGAPRRQATIWARDKTGGATDGNVYAYALGLDANNQATYTSLTTPASGYLILAGSGTTAANYPTIGSSGDLTSDGFADLWTIDKNGTIGTWAGLNHSTVTGRVDGFTSPVLVGYTKTSITNAATRTTSGITGAKCIDDANAGQSLGNPIQIDDCNGTPAQQWTVNPNGTLNVMSGCLDNTNANTANGNLVEWYTCNGTPAQQWTPRADGSIYNPQSGRCLDDPNDNLTNTTRLELFDCNGSPAQRWAVTPAY